MTKPDFSKIWGTNGNVTYQFSDDNYLEGWQFIGNVPPAREMFDAYFNGTDKKLKYLLDTSTSDLSDNNAFHAESTGYGIVSGCTLSVSGLTATISSGVVHTSTGKRVEISQQTVNLNPADASNPRIDVIYIDTDGNVGYLPGSTTSTAAPDLEAGWIKLGEITIAAGATTGTITADYNHYKNPFIMFNNVKTMKQDRTLMGKMVAITLGYYQPNDGGGAMYVIRGKTDSDTDDEGSIIVLDNGNVAELIVENAVNVKQFGAKGDGATDDTGSITNAIAYVTQHKKNETLTGTVISSQVVPVFLPPGTYNVNTSLEIPAYLNMVGSGITSTEICATSSMDAVIAVVGDGVSNARYQLKISNIRINCNNVANDGISNYESGTWLDGANFTNIYIYKSLRYGMHIVSTWCSTFDNITIDGASVGVAYHRSSSSNGFNNNKITNLNIHNCALIGAFLEMQNCSVNVLNIDKLGEYKNSDYTAGLTTVTINDTAYTKSCALYITGMTDTSQINTTWFEWITQTTIPCIIVEGIETYANGLFKAKTVEINDVHIGAACADIYHILSGNVIIDGLRYELTSDSTSNVIDTTGAVTNTSLYVKNITYEKILQRSKITLPYGAFTAQVVENNGHLSMYCPDYGGSFTYKNGTNHFYRYDTTTNMYTEYQGSTITRKTIDGVPYFPQVAFYITQTYTASGTPDSWADLGVFPKVSGVLPIVSPRSAESAVVIQSGYYTQYQFVTGDDSKTHLQVRIVARAVTTVTATFGVAIFIQTPTRVSQ